MGTDAILLRTQPDGRLVRLVREGYETAFEEIVRRYRRPLDRFAASIVGGHSEDVTQDSFRKALVALRREDGEIELRPWLYRIVRNTALNDLRDRPPAAAELAEELMVGTRSAAAEAEERAEVAALTAKLRALPERQRAALVMRELEGMGHEEIAGVLGISGGAARQAIARGRAAVRGGLGALVPLPLLRALAGGGGDAATEAAVGAGATATGVGALKVGLATVVVAGGIGAGVAIDHHTTRPHAPDRPQAVGPAHVPAPSGPKVRQVASTADPATPSPVIVEVADDHRRGGHERGEGHEGGGHRGSGSENGRGPETTIAVTPTASDVPAPESVGKSGGGPGPSTKGGGGPGPSGSSGGHDSGGHGGDDHSGSDGDDRSGHGGGSDDGSGSTSGSGSRSGSHSGSSGSGSGSDSGSSDSGSSSGGHGSDDSAETLVEAPPVEAAPVETLAAESSPSGGPGPSSSGDDGSGSSGGHGSDDSSEISP